MDKLSIFINSIDWVFAAVILIGGRYWGQKYFTISKKAPLNFLAFATLFGLIWLGIKYYTGGTLKDEAMNLFITYLFTTSFYELLAKKLFEWIEGFFGKQPVKTEYKAPNDEEQQNNKP